MSSTYIPSALRRQVEERADGRCEGCQIHQDDAYFSFRCDHIIAEKHGDATTLDNLALTCAPCNRAKDSDIASLDDARRLQPLYNPRLARWNEHFELDEEYLVARTPIRTSDFACLGAQPCGASQRATRVDRSRALPTR